MPGSSSASGPGSTPGRPGPVRVARLVLTASEVSRLDPAETPAAGQATNGWPDSLVMGRPAACQPTMPSATLLACQPAPASACAA